MNVMAVYRYMRNPNDPSGERIYTRIALKNYGKTPPSEDPEDDWQPYKRTTKRRFTGKRADWKRRSAISFARRSANIENT